jgi:hypothetical protein
MQTVDGKQKGVKLILEERGVNTKGMLLAQMKDRLNLFSDFK